MCIGRLALLCRLDLDQVQQGSLQQPLVHLARVTASQACSLVTLSALDLARFGPHLVTGMQQYASTRREWRNHRMTLCRNAAQVSRGLYATNLRYVFAYSGKPFLEEKCNLKNVDCKEREYVRKSQTQNTLHGLALSRLSRCEHGVRACNTLACLSTWLSHVNLFKACARDALTCKYVVYFQTTLGKVAAGMPERQCSDWVWSVWSASFGTSDISNNIE